ncbi:MAG: 50S ribosomal protein L25 [Lachnospiraceae bacterium]|nr:50S ribosomal protein L25 [Lachnospiraceae bacterium]
MTTLKAEKRDMNTKAKKLRREGYVTGNVFGKTIEGSIPLQFPVKEIEHLLKTKNKGSQIMLDIDGEQMDVLIKEIDYNSLKHKVEEIDFQALVSGEKVHSVAEIVLKSHEKVTIGVIQQMLQEIPFKAVPAALVEKVEIDVAKMHVGDTIKVKDLPIASDKDVDLQIDPEEIVVMLSESHNAPIEEEETASEE